MAWQRKRKNRRFGRKHVLDVKLRAKERSRARLRWLTLALGVAGATALGVLLFFRGGDWLLTRFVYQNPAFAIHHIDVENEGVIDDQQIRRWAGVNLDENLLAVDLARVKRDLEMMPVIQSVSVQRILPHTIRLRVTERVAVAQVKVLQTDAGGHYNILVYLLDDRGYVMLPLKPQQLSIPSARITDRLPEIDGLNPAQLHLGRSLELPKLQAALQLILAFSQSPMAGVVGLQRVDISRPGILVATSDGDSEITFALEDLDRQLNRWRSIHDYGVRIGKRIVSLDLAVSNNVPVCWADAVFPPEKSDVRKPAGHHKKYV